MGLWLLIHVGTKVVMSVNHYRAEIVTALNKLSFYLIQPYMILYNVSCIVRLFSKWSTNSCQISFYLTANIKQHNSGEQ